VQGGSVLRFANQRCEKAATDRGDVPKRGGKKGKKKSKNYLFSRTRMEKDFETGILEGEKTWIKW